MSIFLSELPQHFLLVAMGLLLPSYWHIIPAKPRGPLLIILLTSELGIFLNFSQQYIDKIWN